MPRKYVGAVIAAILCLPTSKLRALSCHTRLHRSIVSRKLEQRVFVLAGSGLLSLSALEALSKSRFNKSTVFAGVMKELSYGRLGLAAGVTSFLAGNLITDEEWKTAKTLYQALLETRAESIGPDLTGLTSYLNLNRIRFGTGETAFTPEKVSIATRILTAQGRICSLEQITPWKITKKYSEVLSALAN